MTDSKMNNQDIVDVAKQKGVFSWLKKNISWILLIIVVIGGGIFGGHQYFAYEGEISRLDSTNTAYEKREAELQQLIDKESPYRDQIDAVIQQYEEQIEVEKQKRRYAEQRLNSIIDAIYPMRELDSFADNALFQ